MSTPKGPTPTGTDWTRLLTDPDLVSHLGKLLQTYREAPAEKREEALLAAMREIKSAASAGRSKQESATADTATPPVPVATAPAATPPFQPDIFTPTYGQDRRRYPRIKCFVAVEIRMEGQDAPVWGNLANTSLGGCFVETVTPLKPGVNVDIGLWVANGKIWVKGIALSGIVTRSNPSFGVRIKFSELESPERESLRQFLKFVESTTKGYSVEHGYLAQLKR
ncbi:MAG TPA: PilZ domain-containing protein [Terriglobales bacterium]|nr:PilZ domain-containing protein [Terriglobales bacterium]